MEYFDRNSLLKIDGKTKIVPFIRLDNKSTDKTIVYKKSTTRLDILSEMYYNNPTYGWLILLANPSYGSLEYEIKDRDIIRIPFPLRETLREYNSKVKQYIEING